MSNCILELKDAMKNMDRESDFYKNKLFELRQRSINLCKKHPIYED